MIETRFPDPAVRFGPYGGRYVPEVLIPALDELEGAWLAAKIDPTFLDAFDRDLREFAGRETPLTPAWHLTEAFGGATVC